MRASGLIFFFLSLPFISCETSNSFDLGVLHIEPDESSELVFYTSPDSKKETVFKINFMPEVNSSATLFFSSESDTIYLNPLYARLDINVLVFQVIDQSNGLIKVLVDTRNNETLWLKKDDRQLMTWEDFLLSTFRVRVKNDVNSPLRTQPNDESGIISRNLQFTCLRPIDISGSWLKVRNNHTDCLPENIDKSEFEGYLRWRRNDKVLITFTL